MMEEWLILAWLPDGKLYFIYMIMLTMQQYGKCLEYHAMSSKNIQTNQDLKVCEKPVWTKAERKYFKIKIVAGLEGENCCFCIF